MREGGLKKIDGFLENKYSHSKGSSGRKYSAIHNAFDFLSLMRKWDCIVGKNLARVSIPLKNQQKTLVILSAHSLYSQQLSFMQEIIFKKIISVFPRFRGKIHNLKFQTNEFFFEQRKRPFFSATKKEHIPSLLPHPQSPEYKKLKKEGEEIAGIIRDGVLKDLMVSLYIQLEMTRKNQGNGHGSKSGKISSLK